MTDTEKIVSPEEKSVNPAAGAEMQSGAEEIQVAENSAACLAAEESLNDDAAPAKTEEENPAGEKNVHSMSKEELLVELRLIVDNGNVNAHKEVVAIKQALFSIRQREINEEMNAFVEAGNAPETFSSTPDVLEAESKDLIARFREMRAAYLEEEEKRKAENLVCKNAILAEMNSIADDADNVNAHFTRFQELQQQFKDIKDIPSTAETETWKNFQTVSEKYYDTLKMNKELRDLDFKKNLEQKQRLIDRVKAIDIEGDIVEAGRRLQQIHAEWREIGPVVKDLRESIWNEFKEASAVINRKHQEFFEKRKSEEAANEAAKTALCEEIEAIDYKEFANFAAWDEATQKIKELQAKWKTIGFASRKANNELFSRFRKTCDDFFAAKSAFTQSLKDNLQANLDKKLALCEKAEALQDVEDLRNNLDAVIALQAEWKKIGSVPRKVSDSLWERFTTACNKFFDRLKEQKAGKQNEENANLQAKRDVIEALKEIPLDGDHHESLKKVKELQSKWNEIGHVPFRQKDKIYAQYREVCDALYGAFNAGRENERRRNFEGQLDEMKGDGKRMRSEKERLQRVIEQKQQELKTYSNNLGFFNVKSNAGNSMVKEMQRKMQRIEEDIRDIRKKIDMIDEAAK